jgi:hypothetical protein
LQFVIINNQSSIINEKESGVVSQGTVKKHRRIKLYALGVSVFAHIVGLSVFAAVKIAQSPPVRLQTTTVVSISQAAKLADSRWLRQS